MARHERFVTFRKFLEMKGKELRIAGETSLFMTFPEIEAILGFPLPASAYKHREWWTNNNKYYKPHSLTDRPDKVWERAGFWTRDVDVGAKTVTFEYKGPLSPEDRARRQARVEESHRKVRQILSQRREQQAAPVPGMSEASRPYAKDKCHPAYGAMRGLIRLVAGTDLTKPADPDWGKMDP